MMRIFRFTVRPLVVALSITGAATLLSPATTAAQPAHTSQAPARAAAAAVGEPATTFGGGDVVMLPAPITLASERGSKTWKSVGVPESSVPSAVGGAALVTVTAKQASAPGELTMRPAGDAVTGTTVTSYAKSASSTGSSIVRLGAAGLEWRATAGSPGVEIRLVGWVPRTSGLVVPTNPVHSESVKVGTTARSLTVTGRGGVPAAASPVLVQARTTGASKAGRLAVWKPGTAAPSVGSAFPAGAHSWFMLVTPSSTGKVKLRTLTGAATVRLSVVGWSNADLTLSTGSSARQLTTVKPGTPRQVPVAGRAGVPATDVTMAGLVVNAPKGAVVSVWPDHVESATPDHRYTSRGGAVTIPVRLSDSGTVDISVSGTKAAQVLVTGWSTDPADEQVSFTPKSGTAFYAPSDVLTVGGDGTIIVDSSAAAVPVGGHVVVRSKSGGGAFVGEVLAIDEVPGGRRLSLANAAIADAFVDYVVQYVGHDPSASVTSSASVSDPTTSAPVTMARAAQGSGDTTSAGAASADGVDPLGDKPWDCSDEGESSVTFELGHEGDPNFSFSLADRTLDLSFKQLVTANLTATSSGSLSCTFSRQVLSPKPLGSTGFALTLGASGDLYVAGRGEVVVAGSQRSYAALNVAGTDVSHTEEVGAPAFDSSVDGEITATVGLGVYVGVRTLAVPGIPDDLDAGAEGKVTIGLEFSVERPSGLRGPRCIDVALQPFVEFGLSLLVPFFRDIQLDIGRIDFGRVDLYKGPCVGYTGTIKFHLVFERTTGCPDNCLFEREETHLTLTMAPEPATFPGDGAILQAYSWSGSRTGYHHGTGCDHDWSSSGSGFHGWDVPGETGPYILVDAGADPRTVTVYGDSVEPATKTQTSVCPGSAPTTTVTADGYYARAHIPITGLHLDVEPAPVIDLDHVAQGNYNTDTTTVRLQRVEYPRQ